MANLSDINSFIYMLIKFYLKGIIFIQFLFHIKSFYLNINDLAPINASELQLTES